MPDSPQLRLSLTGARLEEIGEVDGGEADPVLVTASDRRPVSGCSPGLRAALLRLGSASASEAELIELVRAAEPDYPLASLFFHLRALERRGLLGRALVLDGVELVTLRPIATSFELTLPELDEERLLVLSRFAYLRRAPSAQGSALVLESPTSLARLLVHDRRASALIHELAAGDAMTRAQLRAELAGVLPAAALDLLVRLLLGAGFVRAIVDGRTTDESPAMVSWSFADLLFHSRSRIGRHDGFMGKSYPFHGELEPTPALAPTPAGPQLELPRPDLDALLRRDRGFTSVLESRTSIREQSQAPISLAQLGELLYRAARVRGLTPISPTNLYEFTSRPSPSGGACHELEIYLAIDRCEGLERGLYHYDPAGHRLVRVASPSPELDELLARTGVATATGVVSQVLVCLAARFQRVAWAYEGIAYATTLKNVGALLQTLYLVATAMDLAPCAIGYGDSDLFARVAGTDYYRETTVGEFLLGSRPN